MYKRQYTNSLKKSNFYNDVYEVVRLIPKGRVTSYGAIANYLGLTKSARVVGWAMKNSHCDNSIPAHRVVNREGLLTGKHHFVKGGMEKLLIKEGVKIKKNQIVNFNYVFWNPVNELEL